MAIEKSFVVKNGIIANANSVFNGSVRITGGIADSNGNYGTVGQVITSNTTGTYWSTMSTNLSTTYSGNTVIVNSDTGSDATITGANSTAAGVITTAQQTFGGNKIFTGSQNLFTNYLGVGESLLSNTSPENYDFEVFGRASLWNGVDVSTDLTGPNPPDGLYTSYTFRPTANTIGSSRGVSLGTSVFHTAYNLTATTGGGGAVGFYNYLSTSGNAGTSVSLATGVETSINKAGSGSLTSAVGYNATASGAIGTYYGFRQQPYASATNAYGFYSDIASGSNQFNFYANGTAPNYFAGNVGIGISSPTEKLHVEGNARALSFASANGSASAPAYDFAADTNTGMFLAAADTIGFSTNGTNAAQITSTGNLRLFNTAGDRYTEISNQPTANNTLTLPNSGNVTLVSGTMVTTDTSQTISGAKTFTQNVVISSDSTGALTLNRSTDDKYVGTTYTTAGTARWVQYIANTAAADMIFQSRDAAGAVVGAALVLRNSSQRTDAIGTLGIFGGGGGTYFTNITNPALSANRTLTLADGNTTLVSGTMVPTTGTGATGTWAISVTGNAATVTNGVYTTGNQIIDGAKTFTTAINSERPTDFWTSNAGTYYKVSNLGGLSTEGGFAVSITSNGYRKNDATWQSYGANGLNGASQITLNPNGNIYFRTDTTLASGNTQIAPTIRATINGSGNMGIGTQSPAAQLHLYGTGQTSAALTDAGDRGGMIRVSGVGSAAGTGGAILFASQQSETVGSLGYAAIRGLLADGSANTIGHLGFYTRNATTDNQLTERMRLTNSGSVGIGLTNPSTILHASGEITATDFNTTSDINVKKNIEPIDNAIFKISQINGVTFSFIDDPDEQRHAGVIAQDVEKVLPEAVKELNDGIKHVAYGNLIGLLVEAIKDQQKQIDELKALINK